MDFFSLQATAVDRCADLPKLCTEPRKIAHIFRKQSTLKKISKYFIFKSWYPSLIFFTEKKIQKFPLVFDAEKKKIESTNFAIFEEVVHNFDRSDNDMI